ncbi:uncharacterized protein EAE97_000410 [Botrytis byssoidea]|uniref:Ankyrin n=1 Tax=Botrytis byssoidea TaxID=139641 RepID=A0A9P5LZG7_9HELO|nr:uncharacterized protein EAE97_000410 [Botrytis byssoidea]KAF7955151.1 hypothetical protein EAE97_000410 [Botrytis byssoidea]
MSLAKLTALHFLEAWTPGDSVTPLRWAIIYEKPQLVRTLLALGAEFARETFLMPSIAELGEEMKRVEGSLLLETPCTNLEILEMFFARARVPGISSELSQTPLGLLICEYDGPQRRLRQGFECWEKIRKALSLCLQLEPGSEDAALYEAVRFGHVDIVRYFLREFESNVQSQNRGLTYLHTAVLYGHIEMVEFLLSEGAEAHIRTDKRQLTCYHLLMMRPRDGETLRRTLELLSNCKPVIEVGAKEMTSSLTALHMAVRNGNLYGVEWLLKMGADRKIPVTDQLELLSTGIRGYLGQVKDCPRLFTGQLTILGEVVAQYIQDGYYKPQYIAALLDTVLAECDGTISLEDLLIDGGSSISLLHLLSIIPFPTPDRSVHTWNGFIMDDSDDEDTHRTPAPLANTRDLHGDTPLHYACAACEIYAIKALLSAGADPYAQNNFGLRPIEVLCWTRIFCGGQSFRVRFDTGKQGYPVYRQREVKENQVKEAVVHEGYTLGMKRAFEVFENRGCVVDARPKSLALAWGVLREGYASEERGLGLKRMNYLKEEKVGEKNKTHDKNVNVDEKEDVDKYICKIFLESSRY